MKIVTQANPGMTVDGNEVELELSKLDNRTMWRLHDFLEKVARKPPPKPKKHATIPPAQSRSWRASMQQAQRSTGGALRQNEAARHAIDSQFEARLDGLGGAEDLSDFIGQVDDDESLALMPAGGGGGSLFDDLLATKTQYLEQEQRHLALQRQQQQQMRSQEEQARLSEEQARRERERERDEQRAAERAKRERERSAPTDMLGQSNAMSQFESGDFDAYGAGGF